MNSSAIFIILASLVIGILLGILQERIKRKVFKNIDVYFLDRNVHKVIYKFKSIPDTFSYGGKTFVFNWEYVQNNCAFFDSRYTEQLKIEIDNSRMQYFINSKTFDKVYKNKILEKLMLIQESNYIKIILIIAVLILLTTIVILFTLNNIMTDISILNLKLNELSNVILIG